MPITKGWLDLDSIHPVNLYSEVERKLFIPYFLGLRVVSDTKSSEVWLETRHYHHNLSQTKAKVKENVAQFLGSCHAPW